MRKFLKIIFPILLISSLLMVGVKTTNATSSNLGVKPGDTYEYTIGWNFGLNLPDSMWSEISTMASAYNITIDAKQLYTDLSSLPSVFDMKAIVGNIYSNPSGLFASQIYNTTFQMKLTNETNYMNFDTFLNHLMNIYGNTMQKYNSIFYALTNESNFFGNMAKNILQFFISSSYGQLFSSSSGSTFFNESYIMGEMFSLFVPTDFSFKSEINVTAIDNQMNRPYTEYVWNSTTNTSTEINYPSEWAYLHQTEGLPSSVNTYNELLTAYGITTFDIKDKSVFIKYNFADMNQDFLNNLINMSLTNMINASMGFGNVSSLTELLGLISSETGMNVTVPTITSTDGVTYDNNGILQNIHAEFDFAWTINGTSVEFYPQFDISNGVHDSINAKWNPSGASSIPGYPIWLIGLASLGGMMAIILSMKKKKR